MSMKIRAREACDSGTAQVTHEEKAVTRSAGYNPGVAGSWGSAPFHPRLYAGAALRGLRRRAMC